MKGPFIVDWSFQQKSATPVRLRAGLASQLRAPDGYLPDPGLKQAVDTALQLGQPLLLSGEPGVGKSSLARALARALGWTYFEIFAHSELSRRELFYEFDHLRRIFDTHTPVGPKPDLEYIEFSALGRAILEAGGADAQAKPPPGVEGEPRSFQDLVGQSLVLRKEPTRSVILIDEIDKAPRDLLNDILNEVELMMFDIRELGLRVDADAAYRPALVLTSNSEKSLPAPFLRRCVFYHIPFPPMTRDEAEQRYPGVDPQDVPVLHDIVARRIGALKQDDRLLSEAIDLFGRLRDAAPGLSKKPGTAELLSWLLLVVNDAGISPNSDLRKDERTLFGYLSVVAKSHEDAARAREIIEEWRTH